jgi:hypothetical protein
MKQLYSICFRYQESIRSQRTGYGGLLLTDSPIGLCRLPRRTNLLAFLRPYFARNSTSKEVYKALRSEQHWG